jgi:hypothetical protein
MKAYELVKTQPVAEFWYKGSHTHPMQKVGLVIKERTDATRITMYVLKDGKQTFILKLQYDETIFALRKYIDTHRAKLAKEQGKPAPASKYEIRSAFPARAYSEAKETLREAGLIPNATLFLRAL